MTRAELERGLGRTSPPRSLCVQSRLSLAISRLVTAASKKLRGVDPLPKDFEFVEGQPVFPAVVIATELQVARTSGDERVAAHIGGSLAADNTQHVGFRPGG